MARSGLKAFPTEWKDGLLAAVASRSDDDVRDALREALGVFRRAAADFRDIIEKVSEVPRAEAIPPAKDLEFRLALLAARPAGQPLDVPPMSRPPR